MRGRLSSQKFELAVDRPRPSYDDTKTDLFTYELQVIQWMDRLAIIAPIGSRSVKDEKCLSWEQNSAYTTVVYSHQ